MGRMVAPIDENENDFQYRSRGAPCAWLLLAAAVAARRRLRRGRRRRPARATGSTVVATTTQAADLARNVGGDRVEVVQLLAPNADPHDYEVRPRDVAGARRRRPRRALRRRRRRVARRGDRGRRHRRAGPDAERRRRRCEATTRTGGRTRATRCVAVGEIREALARPTRAGAAVYDANAAAYARQLRRSTARSPPASTRSRAAQRKLVTTHDALGYYARRYGIDVVGAVIPSLSTAASRRRATPPSWCGRSERDGRAGDLRRELGEPEGRGGDRARDRRDGRHGRCGPTRSGRAGSDGATYLQSIAANTRAMVDGFTGGAVRCRSDACAPFDAPFMQRALLESLLLAGLAGVLGSWIVLRRLAFFTHGVGTAAFPGLVVAGPAGVAPQLDRRSPRRCCTRAGSSGSRARGGSPRRRDGAACWWRRWRSASSSPPTSSSPAPASTGCCSAA